MSLQAAPRWGGGEESDLRRTIVRPKSAKGRTRTGCILPQDSPQTSARGSAPPERRSGVSGAEPERTQSPELSRTSTESREDKSLHSTRPMKVQKAKSAGKDTRKGSGHPKGLSRSQTKVTRLCSPQSSTDLIFTQPSKAPCTLNRYTILPSIGRMGERASGLCSEDRGA